jgi:hypothetical protein
VQAIGENSKAIAWNAQHIEDLSWTPWGVAISACRAAHSAIVQAMHIFQGDAEHHEDVSRIAWDAAISAARNTASAIRQAVDIAKLYRLVQALSAGGI